jgi:hypothetical protein
MPLQKKWDWERAFDDFLQARAEALFAWGSNDCALFAADAIEAITGTDIAAVFRDENGRGKYATELGAFQTIQAVTGGSTVPDAAVYCAAKFGMVEWADASGKPLPLFAQRGDLVVIQNGSNQIAGVVHLNGKHVVSVSETGPVRLPVAAIVRAWHV